MHTARTRVRMFIAAMMVFIALGLAGVSQLGTPTSGPALGFHFVAVVSKSSP